ncbi:MAG: DUF2264 domain-containing protein [Lachnospiraceae bacterium]|nr:DUF2264 domain-containing protein [Lachnospiraceae bacterium]
MVFKPTHTDTNLSPFTGMTRESWIEAGKYLLEGVFNNIRDFEAPVVLPRTETEITYPHSGSDPQSFRQQQLAEIFEGLTRTFFIAAPLIHEEPDLKINGIVLKDYYRHHILRVIDPEDDMFVGSYEYLSKLTGSKDPTKVFQQTVETCALVIGLWLSEREIWDDYDEKEKNAIADFLGGFAGAPTVPQNWRFFNMLSLAFLNMHGYKIDQNIMIDHAQAILSYYTGDGWYRDGQCFDYYSCWAFNLYAPIWNIWYGYENLPYIAERFEEYSNKLMETYPSFFDLDGHTNMWGRSCIYRFAAPSPFIGNLLLRHHSIDPGTARRICSGSLLQFLSRDDFLSEDGVPMLGFYGQFGPLVQGYSCAESPYWLGKAFLCLYLPKDHPFWTDTEKSGWIFSSAVKETHLAGPGLVFSNHSANKETILRTAKVRKEKKDIHGMWNYGKLSYNSAFPWESTPMINTEGFDTKEVESEQYVIKDLTTGDLLHPNVILYGKYNGQSDSSITDHSSGTLAASPAGRPDPGIFYRRLFFGFDMNTENHWNQAVDAADHPMPLGILRADRLRLYRKPVRITLGSYGFPDNGTVITEVSNGSAKAIILEGKDHMGCPRKLAMTVYDGWDAINITKSRGTNPDSPDSIVLFASATRKNLYDAGEQYIMISQVITRTDDTPFTEEELFPVGSVEYTDETGTGAYGPVKLKLKSGKILVFDFSGMESSLTL